METRFEVQFKEIVEAFCLGFEDIHLVNDGGYERGYAEGHDVGFAEGETVGYANGYDKGVEDATPSGEIELTENKTYDVAKYASAKVAVVSGNKLPSVLDGTVTELTATDLAGATKIGNYLFQESGIESIVIPEGVESIGMYAFYKCTKLKNVTFPKSLTTLGSRAFCDCSAIESIYIPENITSVASECFSSCKFKHIYFDSLAHWLSIDWGYSSSVPTNGGGDLYINGELLTDCVVDVPTIFQGAFTKCKKLTTITLTENVTTIGNSAFSNSGITSLIIPDSVTSLGSSLCYYCESLESVTIGSGVPKIPSSAFYSCIRLKNVSLSDGLTAIEGSAFNGCYNISAIAIPKTVTSIGYSTFGGCRKITIDLTAYGTDGAFPTLASTSAFSTSADFKIIVPSGRKSELSAMTNWSSLANYIMEV